MYKRQLQHAGRPSGPGGGNRSIHGGGSRRDRGLAALTGSCLLYTSDAADERSSVDLGGRRIIKKTTRER